jgi:hypothetical protein
MSSHKLRKSSDIAEKQTDLFIVEGAITTSTTYIDCLAYIFYFINNIMQMVGESIIKERRWKQVVYTAFLKAALNILWGLSRSNFKVLLK